MFSLSLPLYLRTVLSSAHGSVQVKGFKLADQCHILWSTYIYHDGL